jgi:hypothetical protein
MPSGEIEIIVSATCNGMLVLLMGEIYVVRRFDHLR